MMIGEKVLESLDANLQKKNTPVKLDVRYTTHKLVRFDQTTGKMVEEQVKLRSYNGQLMGPLIERRPGDTLLISLSNFLPPNPPEKPHSDGEMHNGFHGLNTTNLHVHGMHVSPAGNSDNVQLEIAPGEHFHYELKIPDDHPPGTYWYHAHKHGSTAVQVASGMAGPLIIRGAIDELPPIRAATEHLFFFQEILYVRGIPDPEDPTRAVNGLEGQIEPFVPGFEEQNGIRFSVNGMFAPTVRMTPGDVHRWRFIHAGAHERLEVRLVSEEDPKRVIPQYQIAHDGITTGRLDRVETTELYSGYRTDVLVHAVDEQGRPLKPGVYLLLDDKNPDIALERRVLARIEVKGWPACHKQLPTEAELQRHARPPITLPEDGEITEQHVEFSTSTDPNNLSFMINGKQFNINDPPLQLQLGRVDRWIISSKDDPLPGLEHALDHSFHIHVNPFQVETPDGKVLWKDTISVGPRQTVRLLTRYDLYVGVFPFHCHFLFHEDFGMMKYVEIKEGQPNHKPDHG